MTNDLYVFIGKNLIFVKRFKYRHHREINTYTYKTTGDTMKMFKIVETVSY